MYAFPHTSVEPIIGTILEVDNLLIGTVVTKLQREEVSNVSIDFMVHLMCLSGYPCNPETDLPLFFCEESCRIFQQFTAAGLQQDLVDSIHTFSMTMGNEMFMVDDIIMDFNCTDLVFPEYDPDTCTNLFSPEVQGKAMKNCRWQLLVSWSCRIDSLVFFVFCCGGCCCCLFFLCY